MEAILFEWIKTQGFEIAVFGILIWVLYKKVTDLENKNDALSEKIIEMYATSMIEATQVITSNTNVLQKVEDKLNEKNH